MKLMELYRDKVIGAISGLDRIRFRGTLRWLATKSGLASFMSHSHILLKDFSGWVEGLTAMIRRSCEATAGKLGIDMHYLSGSGVDKEKLALYFADGEGLESEQEAGIGDGKPQMYLDISLF